MWEQAAVCCLCGETRDLLLQAPLQCFNTSRSKISFPLPIYGHNGHPSFARNLSSEIAPGTDTASYVNGSVWFTRDILSDIEMGPADIKYQNLFKKLLSGSGISYVNALC